jgi:hypothetical protein
VDYGPVVTAAAKENILKLVQSGVDQGAELVVDGRDFKLQGYEDGFFVGPHLFDKVTPDMDIYRKEIFGPVLTTVRAGSYEEALGLAMDHEYGNGTAIFTRDGDTARDFASRINIGMVGVNVPIPVPLAYHTFGGWKKSVFGDLNPARHGQFPVLHPDQDRHRPLALGASRKAGVPLQADGLTHGAGRVRTRPTLSRRRRRIAMDFALNEEQEAIFDMAHSFGQEKIAPNARTWEREGNIPKELWPQVGALGFGGLYVSEEHGGAGLTRLDATLVFEALSMACPSVAAFLSIHNMCARMLDSFASDELRGRVDAQGAHHGDGALLLPDGTRLGLGRRRAEDARRADERGLPAERHQGLHLGRRIFRRLRGDGADRRRGAEGGLDALRRGRHRGAVVRRARGQDGLAEPADAPGPV